jgi:hypothetical protein
MKKSEKTEQQSKLVSPLFSLNLYNRKKNNAQKSMIFTAT